MAKILRKLTLREIVGSKLVMLKLAQTGATADDDGEFKGVGRLVDAALITGRAYDAKVGEGDNGPFTKLMGSFQGKNLATGKMTAECGICIMPEYVASQIASAIANGSRNVEFKIKYQIRFDESSAVGYTFEAENMLNHDENVSSLASLWGDDAPELIEAAVRAPGALLNHDTGEAAAPSPAPAARKAAPTPAPAPKKAAPAPAKPAKRR